MSKRAKKGYTGPRVKSTETFIQKSTWRHDNEYDYSKVEYKGASEKVEIICRKHGPFWQSASDHANLGAGCRDCKYEFMKEILSSDKDEFSRQATETHKGKYTYDKVVYKNNRTKVWITCPDHGDFKQSPDGHLRGEGCPKCKAVTIGNLRRKDVEEFVRQAREFHGDVYDYSLVVYQNQTTPVKIICQTHGIFEQAPYGHLRHGCNQCWKDRMSETLTTPNEVFIEKAREIHGDTYDYSLCNFSGYMEKVLIVCKDHGTFEQRAGNHIFHSSKCPACSMMQSQGWGSHKLLYSSDKPSNIYLIRLHGEGEDFLKIGLAANMKSRHRIISYDSGYDYELLYYKEAPANLLFKVEQNIIRSGMFINYLPDTKFGGCTECLVLGQEEAIISYIEKETEECMSA